MCEKKEVFAMIDTIRLSLDVSSPPKGFRNMKNENGVIKGIINPTREQKESGLYYPRVTYIERPKNGGIQRQLSVEFSAPKLLYGNNFDELPDGSFNEVAKALSLRLREMGIGFFFSEMLKKARITKVDFSKNVIFDDGTTVSQILNVLNRAELKKVFDESNVEFRNGGKIMRIHTNTREIAAYDKIADLRQSKISEKRSYSRGNYGQLSMLDELAQYGQRAVFRLEVRLNSAKTIKDTFKIVGLDENDVTLEKILSANTSKAILGHYWNTIISALPVHQIDEMTVGNVFASLASDYDLKPQKMMASLGLIILSNSSNYDARYCRNVFEAKYGQGSWRRLTKNVPTYMKTRNATRLARITKEIREMKPTRINEIAKELLL